MSQYWPMIGFAIILFSAAGYWREMFKGKARPNRVTTLLWSVEGTIAAIAAISDGVSWAVLPVVASGLCPFIGFVLSFVLKQAYWKISLFDIMCGSFSVLALVLWGLTGEPNVAICFAILADFAASVPTIIKSWKHPHTESIIGYAPCILGFGTSFLALQRYSFGEVAFPAYGALVCAVIAVLIFAGKRRQAALPLFRGAGEDVLAG